MADATDTAIIEFTSDHHAPGRRYRVVSAVEGSMPLVEFLHPVYGWREARHYNTREAAHVLVFGRQRPGVQAAQIDAIAAACVVS